MGKTLTSRDGVAAAYRGRQLEEGSIWFLNGCDFLYHYFIGTFKNLSLRFAGNLNDWDKAELTTRHEGSARRSGSTGVIREGANCQAPLVDERELSTEQPCTLGSPPSWHLQDHIRDRGARGSRS
ncbi:hypothetical protein KQX54_006340 [Cotesia glomerata]|uniref:Uncharacterized protein n=1 Tax=Cotesia glomerata TaxID=32391 RepID=A0AAV7I7A4_COTGL|nr:hypothetical protein KQX54_006340 [Cotesia glomerata]